jgi:hypothetical protein
MPISTDLYTLSIPSIEDVTEGEMSIEDKVTVDERRKYLGKMQEHYLQADR